MFKRVERLSGLPLINVAGREPRAAIDNLPDRGELAPHTVRKGVGCIGLASAPHGSSRQDIAEGAPVKPLNRPGWRPPPRRDGQHEHDQVPIHEWISNLDTIPDR